MTKEKVDKNGGSSGGSVDWRFWLAAIVYVGTGILQPMVIDYLKGYNALGRKVLLLPTLANVMGMALCGCLASKEEWANFSFHANHRVIGMASIIDWISGMLCTGGILLTGGAIFVILYNSCPAWTALLSWLCLNQSLSSIQLLGIILVILGLIANVWGTKATTTTTTTSTNTTGVVIGSLVVLAGSFLHSAMFVVSDYALNANQKASTTKKIPPTIWSCCLGTLESIAMILWVSGHIYHNGFHDTTTTTMESNTTEDTMSFVVMGFIGLLLVDAFHAVSFFALLSSLGAIGSALLKGVQTIIVVILSGIFFCSVDTPQQCMTVSKGISMFMILSGVFTFAFGKKNNKKKKTKVKLSPSPSFADTTTTKFNHHPTEQTKSLLPKK